MAKVNIYIPDDLFYEVNASAVMDGKSRSAVIQEALAEYVAGKRTATLETERRDRMERALRIADEIAASSRENDRYPDIMASELLLEARWAQDDPSEEELVRRIRAKRAQK
jgi:hypothetical protein